MGRETLKDFAFKLGQTKAAALLGMTQGSLNKALRTGRHVYVSESPDGTYSAEEIRPFPFRSAPKTTDEDDVAR
ncbi:Cro/CI family transcriptional regulator [Pseudomonas putida]|uniref:Cro/CI family transcriptional regulator n=1 Tax=Pseudomonas putida TaxID=303 RepID=UPI000E042165|nr:Cro/CI family transcriptional regulator [Pseudomonas putida]SUD78182.1 regulatory protein Cro [Pseudomonas putida]